MIDPQNGLDFCSLPETNKAPDNQWLEEDEVSFWDGIFSDAMSC